MTEADRGKPSTSDRLIGPTTLSTGQQAPSNEQRLEENRPGLPIVSVGVEAQHDETQPCPPCWLCQTPMQRTTETREVWSNKLVVRVTGIPVYHCDPCDTQTIHFPGHLEFLNKVIELIAPTNDRDTLTFLRQERGALQQVQKLWALNPSTRSN